MLSNPVDFEGGEIYMLTPQNTQKHFTKHESMSTEQKAAWVTGHEALPCVADYGCGDTLAFTGDRHLHGTLPVSHGQFLWRHATYARALGPRALV